MLQAWAAATEFDATSTLNEDGKQQHVNDFNDFEELSRLCERGCAQSGTCLLKSAWLQEKFAEAQRTDVPFVLPSRTALPSDASYPGPTTEDQVYITALSYCWAGPGQPDPTDVCELLGYLDTSRHFGDDDPELPKEVMGEPMEETPNEPGTSSSAAPKAAPPPKVDKKTALLQKLVGLRLAYGHKPPPGM